MTRPLAVLRPEPGNAATARRIETAGHRAVRLPLFATRALGWSAPDAAAHDALLLTSANAVRSAGDGLAELAGLPVFAVGKATADAARDAGLQVAYQGYGDGRALIAAAQVRGIQRALLLAGYDRTIDTGGIVARAIAVYSSDPVPVDPAQLEAIAGSVALLHSSRAGARLADLVERAGIDRAAVRIAAISPAVADAAGPGWAALAVSAAPNDAALIAAALALAD